MAKVGSEGFATSIDTWNFQNRGGEIEFSAQGALYSNKPFDVEVMLDRPMGRDRDLGVACDDAPAFVLVCDLLVVSRHHVSQALAVFGTFGLQPHHKFVCY